VCAAGKAPKVGMELWRCKYQNSSVAYHALSKSLIELYRGRYKAESEDTARRVVAEALSEFLGPACQSCNGAREMILDELRIECQDCKGSGLRRYSDYDRARRMQISMQKVRSLSHKLGWLAGELGSMDRLVNAIMVDELERA
jgi:hypothetical protein